MMEQDRLGGYRDRPWIPRFWDGMTAGAWLRLLARNRFAVSPDRWAMAGIVTTASLINSLLARWQSVRLGRHIRRVRIEPEPIFIVGHWRSGTTLLHEYLVLDPRHTYPDTYQCFVPGHHLVSRRVLAPLVGLVMPNKRPMDNMAAGWDRPQEDEFALCNLGVPSPYLDIAFAERAPQYAGYLSLDGLPAEAIERWKRTMVWFLQTVMLRDPRRVVLKSPPHTARLRVLVKLFPQAKFIHITRDPYVVFPSTVNLWQRLARDQGLRHGGRETWDDYVFDSLLRMYEAFERDRPLLGPGQLAELRYEELSCDPVGAIARIYDELKLEGFDRVEQPIRDYAAGQSDYQRNRYAVSAEAAAEIARRWKPFIERYGYRAAPAAA
jgi:hypothetical protein